MTDEQLEAMAIEERNLILDAYWDEYCEDMQADVEFLAELDAEYAMLP